MPKSDLDLTAPELAGYAPVALRIARFYERFPDGRIITRLVSRTAGEVIFRAAVYRSARDVRPAATGWAAEREGDGDINTVACLENTETSAIGRALANLGFTASPHRPSREEMARAERARRSRERTPVPRTTRVTTPPASARASARAQRTSASPRNGAHASDTHPDGARAADTLAADLASLLRSAERSGFPVARAAVVRRAIEVGDLSTARITRLARRLRRWLLRRVDGAVGSAPARDG
ncbi:MAG TPA: hypothetical protein VFK13_09320 [Gemmatimonadaceae bacterium]|nr:hypothetical protein [Gemmatimonadaceae bacterium]